eukprot:7456847-Pyramimonas_sp.AAC.1
MGPPQTRGAAILGILAGHLSARGARDKRSLRRVAHALCEGRGNADGDGHRVYTRTCSRSVLSASQEIPDVAEKSPLQR